MYFGVDYHPEHWVYPFAGTKENPEAQWEEDARLMREAGFNVVRFGEFCWGLVEPEEGKYDFSWLRRLMDIMEKNGLEVVLCTPTAAPPLWLSKNHPEILPMKEDGTILRDGTRRACCLNSDVFWTYSKKIVRAMAEALGDHPKLIAWQIDNGIGGHHTEASFNEESRQDWHNWLRVKYETVENLNNLLGLRFWSQVVTDFDQVPMPMTAPTVHNPALVIDWMRFCSDTIVAYVKCQSDILHEITPKLPVTTNLRALSRNFDHFDVAESLDFVSVDTYATIKTRAAANASEVDILRSLKKTGIKTPDADTGFWVIEQKAGQVNWQSANPLVRPGVVRLFTYQVISRGACGVLYFSYRQARIGSEKFYGGVLTHRGDPNGRAYQEIKQIGEELRLLAPALRGTKVVAEVAILYNHESAWLHKLPMQPTKHYDHWEHIQLYHTALHDRNIPVDFCRPGDDLSQYKVVIAPGLQLLPAGEADLLKIYVQNGGTLVGTFNSGMVDEHNIVPVEGIPGFMTDLFGLEVTEIDPLTSGDENHINFKGLFPASHHHQARVWCDLITPEGCQVIGTFAKDFYAGKPAITLNEFGLGKAIYIGFMGHQPFYYDLVVWLRTLCNIQPLLRVPDTVEVSLRQRDDRRIYFLLNHQPTAVRLHFYKPMHDFLTGQTFTGNYDLPSHGVLVLDEQITMKEAAKPEETPPAEGEPPAPEASAPPVPS